MGIHSRIVAVVLTPRNPSVLELARIILTFRVWDLYSGACTTQVIQDSLVALDNLVFAYAKTACKTNKSVLCLGVRV